MSVAEIAHKFGCSPRSVRNVAYRTGIVMPRARRRLRRDTFLADLVWLHDQLVGQRRSPSTIAADLGCDADDVRAAATQAGVVWRPDQRVIYQQLYVAAASSALAASNRGSGTETRSPAGLS